MSMKEDRAELEMPEDHLVEEVLEKPKKKKKSSKQEEVLEEELPEEIADEAPLEQEMRLVEEVDEELRDRPVKQLGHTHRKMSRALSEMPPAARKYHHIRSGH